MKPAVNDPVGLTIKGGLELLGFSTVERVRSGKYLEVWLDEDDPARVQEEVQEMCRQLLANAVIEDYRFEIEPVLEPAARNGT